MAKMVEATGLARAGMVATIATMVVDLHRGKAEAMEATVASMVEAEAGTTTTSATMVATDAVVK